MPDGIDLAAMLLLIGLLAAWGRQRGCDLHRDRVELNHRMCRNVLRHFDESRERQYRHQLRVDLELAEMLEQAA